MSRSTIPCAPSGTWWQETPKESAVALSEYVVIPRSPSPSRTSEAGWDVVAVNVEAALRHVPLDNSVCAEWDVVAA